MRHGRKGADNEDYIFFAFDDRAFDGKIDGRFDVTVDKSSDGGRVETSGFFQRNAGTAVGVAETVFADTDDEETAAGVGKGDKVPDKFTFGGAGHGVPGHVGFVIQFVGLHAPVNQFFETVIFVGKKSAHDDHSAAKRRC